MFSLREAAALIPGATVIGDENVTFERVSTDSRSARPGRSVRRDQGRSFRRARLPAGRRGAQRDGRSRHAHAARLDRAGAQGHGHARRVSARWRAAGAASSRMPLVAVTGSNGKTTVKEMIASIFAAAVGADARLATAGNFNNDIGLPLTLFRLHAAHQAGGGRTRHESSGRNLGCSAKIAEPTVAVVNNAQREHQEFMATVEAVALEHASVIHALTPERRRRVPRRRRTTRASGASPRPATASWTSR